MPNLPAFLQSLTAGIMIGLAIKEPFYGLAAFAAINTFLLKE